MKAPPVQPLYRSLLLLSVLASSTAPATETDTLPSLPVWQVLEYEQKDGWLTAAARSLVYVKQVKEDEVIAISAACSHLGCIVTWDQEQKIFKCPCHDGRYYMEGRVISGPPPRPLKRHKTKIEDGKIFLATETVPYGGNSHEPA